MSEFKEIDIGLHMMPRKSVVYLFTIKLHYCFLKSHSLRYNLYSVCGTCPVGQFDTRIIVMFFLC